MAQIQIQAIGELFIVTRQVAPGAKSALDDCLAAILSICSRRAVLIDL